MAEDTGRYCCERMADMVDDSRFPVRYSPRFREYAIPEVGHGEHSFVVQRMFHCPWCGCKLPGSLRKAWFERIEAMGLDEIDVFSEIASDPRIPEEMKSDAW